MSDLRETLQGIYERVGELTPDIVLHEAQDPASVLHSQFDWNDTTAAESWRREQAHRLIRTCRVVYKPADDQGQQRSVRAFHAIRNERGYVYEPANVVAADPFKRKLLLNDMQREWQAMKRRWADFEEFTEMVRRDIDDDAA
jgi:hypothetical protein